MSWTFQLLNKQHAKGSCSGIQYVMDCSLVSGKKTGLGGGKRSRLATSPRFPSRLPYLVVFLQHVQTVLASTYLVWTHLELGNGRGQELHLPTENRDKGQGGSSREKRALPGRQVLGRGGGSPGKEFSPRGKSGGQEVRWGKGSEAERGALEPIPTWSSWFFSISSCGRFSSVMLTDCHVGKEGL